MSDVFISYKRSDREKVESIVKALERENISVWFDHDLGVGNSIGFNSEIEMAINESKVVLVCWSKRAAESIFVKAESLRGLELEKLHPVFLEHIELPVPFNAIHTDDLSQWDGKTSDQKWQSILERLKKKISTTPNTGLSAATYLNIIKRLAILIPENEEQDSPAVVLSKFHENRWEITSLLFAIEALIPVIPNNAESYWHDVFHSGHFVPDEIIGHHAIQSFKKVKLLSEKITTATSHSLDVLNRAYQ